MDNTDYFLRNELIQKLGSDNLALFLQAENEENFRKDRDEQQTEAKNKNAKNR